MHAGHQGGGRLTPSVQTAVTLKAGLQFPALVIYGDCVLQVSMRPSNGSRIA